jgi:hypothetical protein
MISIGYAPRSYSRVKSPISENSILLSGMGFAGFAAHLARVKELPPLPT